MTPAGIVSKPVTRLQYAEAGAQAVFWQIEQGELLSSARRTS